MLKNAIDWASRPFPGNALRDRPVAVIGASTGLFGAVWAQAELRKVLHHAGARVLDEELPVGLAGPRSRPGASWPTPTGAAPGAADRIAGPRGPAPLQPVGAGSG